MSTPPRVVLVVLDGFGERPEKQGNSVRLARTPEFHRLYEQSSSTLISLGSMISCGPLLSLIAAFY